MPNLADRLLAELRKLRVEYGGSATLDDVISAEAVKQRCAPPLVNVSRLGKLRVARVPERPPLPIDDQLDRVRQLMKVAPGMTFHKAAYVIMEREAFPEHERRSRYALLRRRSMLHKSKR